MKKNKRLFSLMLVLFMVISIVSPILVEADSVGSLTIHKLYFENRKP